MSTREERVADFATDPQNLDRLNDENRRVVEYAADQMLYGAHATYDPERKPRSASDMSMLREVIVERFNRAGIDTPR